MADAEYDWLVKCIIIGDAGVGKSCILSRFIDGVFNEQSSHTIGVEFGSRVLQVSNKAIKLQIWDTAGQERFRSVTQSYYRGAAGALLVFDISSRKSFNSLATWLKDARELANPAIVIFLVGTKADLEQQREVSFMEASQFALENDMKYLETSALSGSGVEEVFLHVSKSILAKLDAGLIDVGTLNAGVIRGNKSGSDGALGGPAAPAPDSACNC